MRRLLVLLSISLAGCHRSHVSGTTLLQPAPCDKSWYAIVDNTGTDRIYDVYVGTRIVGTADPRRITRIPMDPALGMVTPTLRQAPATRDVRGPALRSGALRMSCE